MAEDGVLVREHVGFALPGHQHAFVAPAERVIRGECVVLAIGQRQVGVRADVVGERHDPIDVRRSLATSGRATRRSCADPECAKPARRFPDGPVEGDRVGAVRRPLTRAEPSIRFAAALVEVGIALSGFIGLVDGLIAVEVEVVSVRGGVGHLRRCHPAPSGDGERGVVREERKLVTHGDAGGGTTRRHRLLWSDT